MAFEYRYTTYPLGGTDTIAHDWVLTEETSLEISFTSPDPFNEQHFFIRAIDNSGNVDATPAELIFYTTQTRAPSTEILEPYLNQEFFILEEPNVWIPGIRLVFTGTDRDGYIIEYGWSVDNADTHWVDAADSVVIIEPSEFMKMKDLSGEHTIQVIAKDDTYLLDPVGAEVEFDLYVPTFEKDILILDDTREEDLGILNVADDSVDAFYEDIFGWSNDWMIDNRNLQTRGFPDYSRLGRYKLVIYHADDTKGDAEIFYMRNPGALARLASYLHVGGDLIIIGDIIPYQSPFLEPMPEQGGYPHPTKVNEGNFVYTYLNIQEVEMSLLTPGTFEGAAGVGGFSDVAFDTKKINQDYPHFGLGIQVAGIVTMGGFTRAISTFVGDDPYAAGLPTLFQGPVFRPDLPGRPITRPLPGLLRLDPVQYSLLKDVQRDGPAPQHHVVEGPDVEVRA